MTNPERIAKGLWWDRAWSLVGGCSYVSPGCVNCWSASEAHMRAGQKNPKIRDRYAGLTEGGKWTGQVRLMENNLDLPLRTRKPQIWAVWNDLFHEDVPFSFIDEVFTRIWAHDRHTFLVLTKRPERMKQFFDTEKAGICPNVWLGVTAENQEQADKRIPILLQTPAAVRFVSVEPMLSEVFLNRYLKWPVCKMWSSVGGDPYTYGKYQWKKQGLVSRDWVGLDWVICGGESGPGARPMHPDWARSLRDQCQAAGVPFFFKQWGEFVPCSSDHGGPDSWTAKGYSNCSNNGYDGKPIEAMDGYGIMIKVGKKKAGRLLDGREWNEFPGIGDGV